MDPSSVTVIGPSASVTDSMNTTDISPLKSSNPASSLPSSSDFMGFRDQLSPRFTRLEAVFASADALSISQPKPFFTPQPLRAVRVLFSPGLYLRNRKV